MTPLDSGAASLARSVGPQHLVRIGLGPIPDPAHLPLLAAEAWGLFAARQLTVGLAATAAAAAEISVAAGDLDALLAGPLLLPATEAATATACERIGCLMRSAGGVLIRSDRLAALCEGDTVRIASISGLPAADGLCRRVLQGWAAQEGRAVAAQTIRVDAVAGLDPLAAIAEGYDGAWPALASNEAVAADSRHLPLRLVTAEESGLPGFTGFDLVARRRRTADETARLEAVIAALADAVRRLQAEPAAAIALWQAHRGDGDTAAAVVRATLPCLKAPLDRGAGGWRAIEALL